MGREIKEGNQCLFMLFTGANFLVFLSSLGMLACAIYMFVVLDPNNFINFYILGVSLVLLLLTLCSFKLRRSVHFLCCYIMIQFVLFTAVLIGSIVLMLNKHRVSSWASDNIKKQLPQEDEENQAKIDQLTEQLSEHITQVGYAFLIFTLILGMSAITGWCYRNSTLDRTFKKSEKKKAQKDMENADKDMNEAMLRNQEKRAMYEQKYPELSKSNQSRNSKTSKNSMK